MTQQLAILNNREVKKIREQVVHQFGYFPEEDYAFLQNEKDRIFIVNKEIARLDLKKLIVDRIGLYFAEICKSQIRLSKEGAQLLGREAAKNEKPLKNCFELDQEEIKQYFQGLDLEKDLGKENRLVLLKYGNDLIGCASYKEKKILNYLPKAHRGEVIV